MGDDVHVAVAVSLQDHVDVEVEADERVEPCCYRIPSPEEGAVGVIPRRFSWLLSRSRRESPTVRQTRCFVCEPTTDSRRQTTRSPPSAGT